MDKMRKEAAGRLLHRANKVLCCAEDNKRTINGVLCSRNDVLRIRVYAHHLLYMDNIFGLMPPSGAVKEVLKRSGLID